MDKLLLGNYTVVEQNFQFSFFSLNIFYSHFKTKFNHVFFRQLMPFIYFSLFKEGCFLIGVHKKEEVVHVY